MDKARENGYGKGYEGGYTSGKGEGYEEGRADGFTDCEAESDAGETFRLREQAFYHGFHWAMRRKKWEAQYVLKIDHTPDELIPYWLGRRVAYYVKLQGW